MRVIDLLQLINDTPANAGIYYQQQETFYPVVHYQVALDAAQPQLQLLTGDVQKKALKRFELIALLNQKKYFQYYVYINLPNTDPVAIYGFKVAYPRIILG